MRVCEECVCVKRVCVGGGRADDQGKQRSQSVYGCQVLVRKENEVINNSIVTEESSETRARHGFRLTRALGC